MAELQARRSPRERGPLADFTVWLAWRLLVWVLVVLFLAICAEGLTVAAVLIATIIVVGTEVAVP